MPAPRAPDQEVPGAHTPERAPLGRGVAPFCLASAVAGSGAVLLIFQSHVTFFSDDWDFLVLRRGFSTGVFLNPHNDHIAVAPIALYKALLAVFGMSSALPFQVVSTLVFLLSVVALFVYIRRCCGDWPAILGSVLILFLGAAWNDLLWSFQIGFGGPVAAGIGALLALDRDDRRGGVLACALLVVAASFSELGIPFVLAAFVHVALGPAPRRSRLYVPLAPLALYGLWYLGWGLKSSHAASFRNLGNSPKFVFDAVSQNLASLLGLATPLHPDAGRHLVGLNWGRILLLIVIALAIWCLRRRRMRSRWLWAVLAAGAAFWFLAALNAIPLKREPTTGRYQYPGAIFVLLIGAEFLRRARIDRRFLAAATAVTVAAAISGLIFLHDGYQLRKYASDSDRAILAAVEIARGQVSPNFPIVLIGQAPVFHAGTYFSAVDEFGSPAFTQAQLAATAETQRAAADRLLAQAEGISLKAASPASDRGAGAAAGCHTLATSQASTVGLKLSPGIYTANARAPQGIQLARFSDVPLVTVGDLRPGSPGALSIPRDRSNRPWRVYSSGPSPVTVCRISSSPQKFEVGSPSQQFHQALMTNNGFTSQRADCIVNKMLAQVGRREFDRLGPHGHADGRLQTVAFLAIASCPARQPGK